MIGGNISAEIQIHTVTKNQIGEAVPTWQTVQTLLGWLDLMSGNAKIETYSAKIQESTHIFIGDYVALNSQITSENSRMIINGKIYQITLIDNPMELNRQWEIYLKYTGGV